MTTLRIPDAALAQHIAILGMTGSGKTFAAKGIVESLLADGRPVRRDRHRARGVRTSGVVFGMMDAMKKPRNKAAKRKSRRDGTSRIIAGEYIPAGAFFTVRKIGRNGKVEAPLNRERSVNTETALVRCK